MKAGFCMLLWTTHVTERHLPLLAAIKAAGYDGIEVPMFEGAPEHYAWLKGELADAGLAATAVGVIPDAGHSPISADAASGSARTLKFSFTQRMRASKWAASGSAGRSGSCSARTRW